jgi:regulator of protease activity HflC (stomatin/prohibitin superfamily)
MVRRLKINPNERGLLFREGEFLGVLKPGAHWRFDPLLKLRLDKVQPLNAWLVHNELDRMVKSGRLGDEVIVADLKDHERALLWIDGRYGGVLSSGVHAFWKAEREIRLEVIDARAMKLVHDDLPHIARSTGVGNLLEVHNVAPGHVACGSAMASTRRRSARACTRSGRTSAR